MDCDAGERACFDDAYRAVKRTITELRKKCPKAKISVSGAGERIETRQISSKEGRLKAQAIKASASRSDSSVPLLAGREGWRLDRGLLPRQGE